MEALLISRTKAEKNPSLFASTHSDFSENDIKVAIEESKSSISDIKQILTEDGFENKSGTFVKIVSVEDNEEDSVIDGLEFLYSLDSSVFDYSNFSETSVSGANEYEKSLASEMKQVLAISSDNNSDNESTITAKTTSDNNSDNESTITAKTTSEENNEEKTDIDVDTETQLISREEENTDNN